MFDVGFSELLMLGLVSLLVIGPERLPKAARFVGFWLGRTRAMVNAVKTEFEQEIHAEEIRQLLKEQSGMGQMKVFSDELSEIKQAIDAAPTGDDMYQLFKKHSLVKDIQPSQQPLSSDTGDSHPETVVLSTEPPANPTDARK